MKISTNEKNEVNPAEIQRLLTAGAAVVFNRQGGAEIGIYSYKNKPIILCAGDSIIINNVTLQLTTGGTFDRTITIN
jgi:hypothetical protein